MMLQQPRSRRGSEASRRTTMSRMSIKSKRKHSPWPPIYNLVPEIVDRICAQAEWPFDIAALCLCCKGFYFRGRPFLYRSIVLSHTNPSVTRNMLRAIEADATMQSFVQRIIVDDEVTPFFAPVVPQRQRVKTGSAGALPHLPVPSDSLSEFAVHIARVLASLKNVTTVYLRFAHPSLLYSNVGIAEQGVLAKLRRSVTNSSTVPYTSLIPQPPHLAWFVLCRLPQLQYLSSSLLSRSAPLRGSSAGLKHLRTLHLGGGALQDEQGPAVWNGALRAIPALQTLILTNISIGIDTLLAGCQFAKLIDLELYKVRADERPGTLSTFIEQHAITLEVLALCVAGTYQFPDHADFPRLHTLRVDNVARLHCFECIYARESALHGGCKGAVRACARFATFVARHQKISDIAISGLIDYDAVRTIVYACNYRVMRRLLIGDLIGEVVAVRVLGVPSSERRRRVEWWVFNELLFKDLELERPAYRPAVFSQGKIHKRH
ncbi:hypothetical protein BKA62DRAFT_703817 [Auriculariales sp. MPI-PUGE-AT-0066]|nr:hypothetical protein BKA62DRAFT_703817 [Auriculariales sp. MPI-PUGE-AT-0066]